MIRSLQQHLMTVSFL